MRARRLSSLRINMMDNKNHIIHTCECGGGGGATFDNQFFIRTNVANLIGEATAADQMRSLPYQLIIIFFSRYVTIKSNASFMRSPARHTKQKFCLHGKKNQEDTFFYFFHE